jgi:hypothetical protein
MLMVVVASILKSAGIVLSGISLGENRLKDRNLTLIVPALVNFLSTFLLLLNNVGMKSLGLALVLSGFTQIAIAWKIEGNFARPKSSFQVALKSLRGLLGNRGLVSLIGISVSQLDKLVLSTFADTKLLRTYDLATRIAAMFKVLSLALLGGALPKFQTASNSHLEKIYKTTRNFNLVLAFVSAVAPIFLLSVLTIVKVNGSSMVPEEYLWLAILAVLSHAFHVLTISPSFYFLAKSQPEQEFKYLIPLFVLYLLFYTTAASWPEQYISVVGMAGSLSLTSFIFFVFTDAKSKERRK